METAPLKSFATWARTALISEVTARIAAVLAPGSTERIEQAQAIAALEKAINVAGGGDKGRAAVADKVAYVWFNRIVALRFMDANSYTGIGVVSPQAGVELGQPEILAEAKRGVIDTEVVRQTTRTAVAALLDGTRSSSDPQGEAYALLLAEYCRHWNRAMPFMFEREGDFTELLIPANLLADASVLNRSVKVLTEDVCEDVEVIGWLYQFYISERKDEVFAGFKKNKKAGAEEIPAATQLFTPHWIVRYLVENSLGRLWMLNRPASGLVDRMDYYVTSVDAGPDFLTITKPEDLKVIDPACGSGHMLTYAFDLLYAIYAEEGYAPTEIPGLIIANNLYGTEIDPRAGALAAFALAMKARAKQRTFFNMLVEPNICVIEPISFTPDELELIAPQGADQDEEVAFWNQFENADIFGSLLRPDPDVTARLERHLETLEHSGDLMMADVIERAHRVVSQSGYLLPRYSVVVANPPYMGSKNMGVALAEFAKREYPDAKADLMTMFMGRGHDLTRPNGFWAMINLPSWMFLKTFTAFRAWLLRECWIQSLIHLGRGVFGSDFGSVAVVCKRSGSDIGRVGVYRRLFEKHVEVRTNEAIRTLFLEPEYGRFELAQASFKDLPGEPIAYWFPDQLFRLFETAPNVSSEARAAKGLVTADNASFVREWWEVSRSRTFFGAASREVAASSGCRWFPYAKGGEFRRWAGNLEAVVDWEDDGRAIQTTLTADGSRVRATNFNLDRIFKPGIAWTVVTSGALSFRQVGEGCLFDAAAGICQGVDESYLLALLNSEAAAQVLHGLNPTLNLHPGYLESVPVPEDSNRERIRSLAQRAVEISIRDWDAHERSWSFEQSPLLGRDDRLVDSVARVQQEWKHLTTELLAIEESNNAHFSALFGLPAPSGGADTTSLSFDPDFSYGGSPPEQQHRAMTRDLVVELVSFAVGCMFGRYGLDERGLILADQGATLEDYLAKVQPGTFAPDTDNVIPIVDGDWFEDDIVAQLRQFLRTAFGEEHFEENLRFLTESLGMKNLRDYFVKSFYKEHVQRYKKRPIYWLFSSPNGSFNALIYIHRYNPSTVSTVLNEYLREFQAKLKASLEHAERSNNAKEADRLRKVLLELDEYEHDVLYPLASQNVVIDLDDGVKANYPKFGDALKPIPGVST